MSDNASVINYLPVPTASGTRLGQAWYSVGQRLPDDISSKPLVVRSSGRAFGWTD